MKYLLLLLCVIPVSATNIYTSVTCSATSLTNNGTTETEIHTAQDFSPAGATCGIPPSADQGSGTFATGVVTALDLPPLGSPATPVRVATFFYAGAYAFVYPDGRLSQQEHADLDMFVDLYLSSPGPVRPGFIRIGLSGGLGPGPDRPSTGIGHASVGSVGVTCSTYSVGSCFGLSQSVYPFTLGTNFTVHEDATIRAAGYNATSNEWESAQGGWDISFILLEADGRTPVQITDATPEPGTLGTIGLGFCSVLGAFFRRRAPRAPSSVEPRRDRFLLAERGGFEPPVEV